MGGFSFSNGSGAPSRLSRPNVIHVVDRPQIGRLAPERPHFVRVRAPQQMAVITKRVLPRPTFGVTPEVQRELDRFLTSERETVARCLERRSTHDDMFERVFEDEGVPLELVTVAAVESKYDRFARSPAGALGMWQFMRSTARLYGLRVGGYKDERTDPVLSTTAAARYLKDLFLSFNDWHLALAAYNAGMGRINRAMSASGTTDFWHLARRGRLSNETARFVPKVIALSMIVQDPDKYGFGTGQAIG